MQAKVQKWVRPWALLEVVWVDWLSAVVKE